MCTLCAQASISDPKVAFRLLPAVVLEHQNAIVKKPPARGPRDLNSNSSGVFVCVPGDFVFVDQRAPAVDSAPTGTITMGCSLTTITARETEQLLLSWGNFSFSHDFATSPVYVCVFVCVTERVLWESSEERREWG